MQIPSVHMLFLTEDWSSHVVISVLASKHSLNSASGHKPWERDGIVMISENSVREVSVPAVLHVHIS